MDKMSAYLFQEMTMPKDQEERIEAILDSFKKLSVNQQYYFLGFLAGVTLHCEEEK